MRYIFFFIVFISYFIKAQTNTEIYVFDIIKENESYNLVNKQKITTIKGYNNQPHFYDSNTVIFSSTNKKNTDISIVKINDKKSKPKFISNTKNGGEYSPQRIPGSNHISAVRLDDSGLQRFYKYEIETGQSSEIIPNLKVAYPTWFNKNTVVSSVIVNDSLHLIVSNLKTKSNYTVDKIVGRSIHKIPNSNLISFISKKNSENWTLNSLNLNNYEIKTICSIGQKEDVTWLTNSIVLISDKSSILQFDYKNDKKTKVFFNFSDQNLNNISRITVNKSGTKIAIVSESKKD